MFLFDERIRGLPAKPEQVASVYQSINSPHLAIPGKQAGPAQAYILGLRGQNGFAVFIYLYLSDEPDCAVYASDRRNLSAEEYEGEESEALGFVESMGFIMDNLNVRNLPPPDLESLMRQLPVFRRDPRAVPPGSQPAAKASAGSATPTGSLARFFASFCLVGLLAPLVLTPLMGCKHVATVREQAAATNRYDLGVLAQQQGDVTGALREYENALTLDDAFPEAHNAIALLFHLSYHRDEEAIRHYQRALEIRPTFTEAKVNLANVYLSEDRYDPAIKLYTDALNDMLYATPFIAQGNLGWAYFKKGDVRRALENIKSAVTVNPKFCLGYRNLGLILEDQGSKDAACEQFAHYQDACPDVADAQFRAGVCLARRGDLNGAKLGFTTCMEKAKDPETKDACRTQLDQVSRMTPPSP